MGWRRHPISLGKVFSLENTGIPKVFYTPHHGRCHQQGDQKITNESMVVLM
jgi:hypothetical protein